MSVPTRSNHSLGFTLIELLVVVAIIALLVAILVPALDGAMNLARTTVCETNYKYMGLGLNLYADADGEGDFPIGRWDAPWQVYNLTRDGVTDARAGRIGLGALYPDYISDGHIFYCPQDAVDWPGDDNGSFEGPRCLGPNWPTVNTPMGPLGILGIMSGRLYGECNTTLAPYGKGLSREVFNFRAIATDWFTLGMGMSAHEIGLPVLRGDSSVFLYQDTEMNDLIGPQGIPVSSGTALAHWWWDKLTGHN
jgi:prepilin-type N-terminal cleavage/methylation domain-containing protein